MKVSIGVDIVHLECRIENLMNLRHPCISGTIGIILPSPLRGLQIIRMYCVGSSLSKVISSSPEWWTPTAKVKTIAGIALGLRFAHSLGFFHGDLTGNNVFFNDDGMIQICDFWMKSLSEIASNSEATEEMGGFSGESWSPTADVQGFAKLLSQIVKCDSADEFGCSRSVPAFVLRIIEKGQSSDSKAMLSFVDIIKTLKRHDFRILEGVDTKEVSTFVSWIEVSEALTE
jgi:hypothetical protein